MTNPNQKLSEIIQLHESFVVSPGYRRLLARFLPDLPGYDAFMSERAEQRRPVGRGVIQWTFGSLPKELTSVDLSIPEGGVL